METLVLDGKNYVKASKAARDLGYATDYVGQLCRSGKVSAHLIGRTWYVNTDELGTHRLEKKRMSRIKARESAHKSIEAHRMKVSSAPNTYKNIDIQYEQDPEELIPQTKKLLVQTSATKHYAEQEITSTRPTYVNKGEKVRMSGSVAVVDVTDGEVDDETFMLSPTAIRKSTPKPEQRETVVHLNIDKEQGFIEETKHVTAFAEKLGAPSVGEPLPVELEGTQDTLVLPQESAPEIQVRQSLLPYLFILLLISSIIALMIPLSLKIHYVGDATPNVISSYSFSLDKIIPFLRFKI